MRSPSRSALQPSRGVAHIFAAPVGRIGDALDDAFRLQPVEDLLHRLLGRGDALDQRRLPDAARAGCVPSMPARVSENQAWPAARIAPTKACCQARLACHSRQPT